MRPIGKPYVLFYCFIVMVGEVSGRGNVRRWSVGEVSVGDVSQNPPPPPHTHNFQNKPTYASQSFNNAFSSDT